MEVQRIQNNSNTFEEKEDLPYVVTWYKDFKL